MPVYINGMTRNSKADIGLTYEHILELLKDSPNSLGDISRFSDLELSYIRQAMGQLAASHVRQLARSRPLHGLDMSKVFDTHECRR